MVPEGTNPPTVGVLSRRPFPLSLRRWLGYLGDRLEVSCPWSMIEDARVFEEGFVPRDLTHRDAEANRLEQALSPVVDGDPGSDAYLFGTTGTGKTTVAKYLLETLGRAAPAVDSQYVNCWRHSTRYGLLYRLTQGLTGAIDLHRTSTPVDELTDRLDASDGQQVAILDEVDRLEDPAVLYDLYHVPTLTLVIIANRESALFTNLPKRVASRLRVGYRIAFGAYDVNELVDILQARVRAGLAPGAIDDRRLERIARAAGGDARVAIAGLHTAARMASDRRLERITDHVLDEAIPRADDPPTEPRPDEFDEHRRVLLEVLRDAESGVQPKRLYSAYADRLGEDARSRRTVQKYLKELVRGGFVRESGASQSRRYHADGRVRRSDAKPS